ncbi:MAG: PIN domain-containing protein [Bacillota bacterium]
MTVVVLPDIILLIVFLYHLIGVHSIASFVVWCGASFLAFFIGGMMKSFLFLEKPYLYNVVMGLIWGYVLFYQLPPILQDKAGVIFALFIIVRLIVTEIHIRSERKKEKERIRKTTTMKKDLFGIEYKVDNNHLTLHHVVSYGSFGRIGLTKGDLVLQLNEIRGGEQLDLYLRDLIRNEKKDELDIIVKRDGETYHTVIRPFVLTEAYSSIALATFSKSPEGNVQVVSTKKGGYLERIGVIPGDTVIKVGIYSVSEPDELVQIFKEITYGETLILSRNGKEFEVLLQPKGYGRKMDRGHERKRNNHRPRREIESVLNMNLHTLSHFKGKDYAMAYDTNILMKYPEMLSEVALTNPIWLSDQVLEELDKHKTNEELSSQARRATRMIEEAQIDGATIIRTQADKQYIKSKKLKWNDPDQLIIASYIKEQEESEKKLLFISEDRGARIVARQMGLDVLEWSS